MSAGTLIVILGICGSGKSELIKRLDVDIFGSTEGFDWNLNGEHERLISALKEGKSCAVIEVGYGDTARRGAFVARSMYSVAVTRKRGCRFGTVHRSVNAGLTESQTR